MKKTIFLLLCMVLLIGVFCFPAYAEDNISVYVNGEKLEFDVQPVLMNDRTLVPMRKIFETLGATVSWNNDTETASGVRNGVRVSCSIDNPTGLIGGETVALDQSPVLLNDRTLVPLRFIAEAFGADVQWVDETQTVNITLENTQAEDGYCITYSDFMDLGSWSLNSDGYLFGTTGSPDGAAGSVPAELPATATFNVQKDGTYKVWSLARDYAANQPGTRYYNVGIDGVMSEEKMGTHGKDGFYWQVVGVYNLTAGEHTVSVYDTSGFYARCKGVFITDDLESEPTTDLNALSNMYNANSAGSGSLSDYQYPYWTTQPMTENETVTLENDTFRVDFIKGTGSKGALVQTEIFVKKDGQWIEVKDKLEQFGYLMMTAEASEPMHIRKPGTSIGQYTKGEEFQQYFSYNDKQFRISTSDYFDSGVGYWFIPTDALKISDNEVVLTFPAKDCATLSVTVSLDSLVAEPKFALNATFSKDGAYSFLLFSGDAVAEEKIERATVPFLFTRETVPQDRAVYSEPFLFTPMVAFTTTEDFGTLTTGIVVDPSVTHQDVAYLETARYGFMVRDRENGVRAQFCAPIFGTDGANFKAGDTYTFAYRILAGTDGWYDTFTHVTQDLYNVQDLRTNYYASLNDAVYNITDLIMDDVYGAWDDNSMGFYYAEYDHQAAQCNVLEIVQRYLMSEDEAYLDERVVPSIAFALSRQSNHFNYDLTDTTILGTHDLGTTPAIGGSAMYTALYKMSQGRMPYMLETAVNKNTKGASQAGITAQEGFYEMTEDEAFLSQIKTDADALIQSMGTEKYKAGAVNAGFVLGDYITYIAPLLHAYELTGEQKYLDAAEGVGQDLMAALSSMGYQNGYADNMYHVDPQTAADAHIINADYATWWWHGDFQWRVECEYGTNLPAAGTVSKVDEDDAPGWTFATVGLTTEHPLTAGHSNFILMNTWAPYMYKLSAYTGDDYFKTQARNAILGRFANYPGYYIERYYTNYMKAEYPYEGPEYNILYYTHVAPFMAIVEDFQMQEVWERSAGKVSFPEIHFDGYSYFTTNQYGAEPGTMYDQDGMWLWNDRGVVSASDININYVAAKKDGVFGVALLNEASVAVTTDVTLGEKMPNSAFSGEVVLYDKDGAKTTASVTNGVFTVTIPAKGIVTAMIAMPGLEKPNYAADEVLYSTETEQTVSDHKNGKGYVIQIDPDKYHAYVYVTDKDLKALTVNYEANGVKGSVTDSVYPFEAIVKVNNGSAVFKYTLTATLADGSTVSYGEGTLVPMPNGPATENIKEAIKAPAASVGGGNLPKDFTSKTCKVSNIGIGEGKLRIAISYDALGFKPEVNAFAGAYVKGTLKANATGAETVFTGKILSNDARDTYFVMQTDYVLSSVPEDFKLAEIEISKTAFTGVTNQQPTTPAEKKDDNTPAGTALPADFTAKTCKVDFIGGAAGCLRIAISYDTMGFTPTENAFAGTYVRGTLKVKSTGKEVAFTGKVSSNDVRDTYFVMQTDYALTDTVENLTLAEVEVSKTAFAGETAQQPADKKEDKKEDNATAGTALPTDFSKKTCEVMFIGEIGGKLRIAISYDALGFTPAVNAFAGTYVKGTLKDKAGKATAFTGKVESNDARDTYFVMQTDYVLSSVPEDFKLAEIEISKTAF